jgi:hypothetical protein
MQHSQVLVPTDNKGSLAIESELKKCRLNMDSRELRQLLGEGYY